MKLDEKGFTLVELLAVVAIMAILMGVATINLSKSQEKARQEAYSAMESSAHAAAQNYIQRHSSVVPTSPSYKTITISTLVEEGLLPKLIDPLKKGETCSGEVLVQKEKGTGNTLDSYKYIVKIQCSRYNGEKEFNS